MYTATPRFWLVFILTICALCTIGCGGSEEPMPDDRAYKPASPASSSSI